MTRRRKQKEEYKLTQSKLQKIIVWYLSNLKPEYNNKKFQAPFIAFDKKN